VGLAGGKFVAGVGNPAEQEVVPRQPEAAELTDFSAPEAVCVGYEVPDGFPKSLPESWRNEHDALLTEVAAIPVDAKPVYGTNGLVRGAVAETYKIDVVRDGQNRITSRVTTSTTLGYVTSFYELTYGDAGILTYHFEELGSDYPPDDRYYVYDTFGRITQVSRGASVLAATYSYGGRSVQWKVNAMTGTQTFDADSRLVSDTYEDGEGTLRINQSFTYDQFGRVSQWVKSTRYFPAGATTAENIDETQNFQNGVCEQP